MKKNSCFTNRIIPRILTYSLDPLLSVVTVSSILARILTHSFRDGKVSSLVVKLAHSEGRQFHTAASYRHHL